ncbi:HAD-IA family hydrolase [Streptomyces sp. NPDC048224]|uniref:HAD family hydrolase n=1 Tax=Streptomyces sp. NPDC048224 TaxID=3154500 RepID=UPI0033F6ACB9
MTAAAVLFDVDGVLLDSAAAHRRVWDSWALSHGLDTETVWRLTFGRRPEDTVRDAAARLDPVLERQVLDQLLARERDGVLPVDGAGELLRDLSGRDWAIVSSGNRDFVEARFAATGLPLPAVRVYGSDVEHAKPAPDCFALAASRLGVAPSACVVVEDAPAGVRAAVAAGCTVIGLTTTHAAAALGEAHRCAASLDEVRGLLIEQGILGQEPEAVVPPGRPGA